MNHESREHALLTHTKREANTLFPRPELFGYINFAIDTICLRLGMFPLVPVPDSELSGLLPATQFSLHELSQVRSLELELANTVPFQRYSIEQEEGAHIVLSFLREHLKLFPKLTKLTLTVFEGPKPPPLPRYWTFHSFVLVRFFLESGMLLRQMGRGDLEIEIARKLEGSGEGKYASPLGGERGEVVTWDGVRAGTTWPREVDSFEEVQKVVKELVVEVS